MEVCEHGQAPSVQGDVIMRQLVKCGPLPTNPSRYSPVHTFMSVWGQGGLRTQIDLLP